MIGAAGVLFLVELFADKIPVFDLLWNALHTFIRVPVAALLAYRATSQLSPEWQLIATLTGGLVALAAHGGKTAVSAAVTPSPEPFSNVMLSLGEDALAIFLTWFSTRHPYWAATIALALVLAIAILVRSLGGTGRSHDDGQRWKKNCTRSPMALEQARESRRAFLGCFALP